MSCLSVLSLFLITLAIYEICSQECSQSSALRPDKGGFLFNSDNSKAQLICQAGFHPENNEYTTLDCDGGEWVGNTPANCVPNKCRRCILEGAKYWPEDGSFQFSPASGSPELMEHRTEATVVCDPDFYPAREDIDHNEFYTTFELETLKCDYGTWVGKRKTKCIMKPAIMAIYELYRTSPIIDYSYLLETDYNAMVGQKHGPMAGVVTDPFVGCPEKMRLYILRSPWNGHHYTTDMSTVQSMQSEGWLADESSLHYYCVAKEGECGATQPWMAFRIPNVVAARYYSVNEATAPNGYVFEFTVCYMWAV